MSLTTSRPTRTSSAQPTVRRLILYVLLFSLVTIGAIGLDGLLDRLLTSEIGRGDTTGLARSLAFTLIGGPLAALLWFFQWRRLADDSERSSLAWALYLAGMRTVALITFSTALLGLAAALVTDDWNIDRLSTGLVWFGVWAWHEWMARHRTRKPRRLVFVATIIAAMFGLILGVGGSFAAFASVLDAAIGVFVEPVVAGDSWWPATLQALIWALGGGVIWWWYWLREGGRTRTSGFADVALILAGILAASALTLVGVGTSLFVLLRLVADQSDPIALLLAPLAPALAGAFIGGVVWRYHRRLAVNRSPATRQADRLVTSGLALAAAATGIGVVVNSVLANTVSPLVGADTRTLLLGGISALVVGGPVWWLVWKPRESTTATQLESTGRRVYLIVVFGLSAIVAIVTLLVIGFRLFEFVLDSVTGASLIDRIRAPLGLLVATALVAGYHFSVWRRDRALWAGIAPPERVRTIDQVVLVTGSGAAEAQVRAIEEASGASVTVWTRAEAADAAVTAEDLTRALEGVTAARVLIVLGPESAIQVIPLTN